MSEGADAPREGSRIDGVVALPRFHAAGPIRPRGRRGQNPGRRLAWVRVPRSFQGHGRKDRQPFRSPIGRSLRTAAFPRGRPDARLLPIARAPLGTVVLPSNRSASAKVPRRQVNPRGRFPRTDRTFQRGPWSRLWAVQPKVRSIVMPPGSRAPALKAPPWNPLTIGSPEALRPTPRLQDVQSRTSPAQVTRL